MNRNSINRSATRAAISSKASRSSRWCSRRHRRQAQAALYGVTAILSINNYAGAQSLIGSYLFTGNSQSNDTFNAPTGEAANVVLGTMSRVGVTASGAKDLFGSTGFSFSAITANKYMDFTISAAAGYQVTVSSISFDDSISKTGPVNAQVGNSANSDVLTFSPSTTTATGVQYDFTDFNVTSSSIGSIAFYAWNAPSNTGTFRLDNIQVYGTVTQLASSAQFWDANGSGGGAGVWSSSNTNTNWNSQADGSGTSAAYDSTKTATFGNTPGVVSIDTNGVVANAGLEFDSDGYTIADGGGSLTLSTTPNISVLNSTDTATLSTEVTGGVGLTKIGAGTLVLTSTGNNFTNDVTIAGGALKVTSDAALGDSNNVVNMNGGTLVLGAPISSPRTFKFNVASTIDTAGSDSTISGPLDGTSTLTKTGDGKLTLQSAATAARVGASTAISGGTLRIENAAALGAGGAVTVNNGGALEIGSVPVNSTAGNGGFGLNLNSGAKLLGTGSAVYSVSNSPSIATGASVTLTTNSSTDVFEVGSAIRNGGTGATINVNGPGTVFISTGATTNTAFSGQWNVNMDPGGILHLGSANSLGNFPSAMGTATVNNGIVALGGFSGVSNVVIPNTITLNGGTLGIIGVSTVTPPASLGYTGQLTVTSGDSVAINSTDVLDSTPGHTLQFYKRLNAGGGSINVYGNGTIITSGVNAGSLSINSGAMSVAQGRDTTNKTGTVNNLSISSGATLDLNDNDLIYDYSNGGSADSNKLTTIRNLLATGFAGGAWTGTGITSSVAKNIAANPGSAPQTAIGYAEASSVTGLSNFDGTSTDGDMIVMRYTLSGDATMDGTVNSADFDALAANFGTTSTGTWVQGDFNYDGIVNALDFNALATNYGASPINSALPDAALAGSALSGALVPEPTTLGALAIGGLMLSARRRKSIN